MKITNESDKCLLAVCMLCALLLLLTSATSAQQAPRVPVTRHPAKDLPIQSRLYDLDVAVSADPANAGRIASQRGFSVRPDGLVKIEIIGTKGGNPVDPAIIGRFGGEVRSTWRHLTSAWIPPQQLIELAQALPSGFYLSKPRQPHPASEGPGVTGSKAYRDGGANGTDLSVAVIDGGFDSLTEARGYGAAPATFTAFDFTGSGLENGSVHGCACVETIFDHARGADYFLYKIEDDVDLGNAIDSAIANDVDVISHSLAWFNLGWADGSGTVNQAVSDATDAGILFFTSAGNYRAHHWRGAFDDGDTDDWHEWDGGGDELNGIDVFNGETIQVCLQWNPAGGTYDYDLLLYDNAMNLLDASDNGGNNPELVEWTNNTGALVGTQVVVERFSGGITDMQLFFLAVDDPEHFISPGSIVCPANSDEDNCISVGAVDHSVYGDASPSTQFYSSRGPTNSGNTAPDMVGPTNTSTVAYGGQLEGPFSGTSCSTPNAAGTALCFWSSDPSLNTNGVRYLLLCKASIFKDWGDPGPDNTFGQGGIALHTYHDSTIWVDRRVGNTAGGDTLPYYYVAHAQSAATSGGRVVFLGQSYPEAVTLNKNLLWETIGSHAVLGTSAKNLQVGE